MSCAGCVAKASNNSTLPSVAADPPKELWPLTDVRLERIGDALINAGLPIAVINPRISVLSTRVANQDQSRRFG